MSLVAPSCYYNAEHDMKVVVHVDDFLCTGEKKDLRWLEIELKKHFQLKSEILGPDKGEVNATGFLGRTISWNDWGLTYSADSKHVKILLKEWDLGFGKPVVSPGSKDDDVKEEDDRGVLLKPAEAKVYRRAAARLNYLALDRPDIGFATKEIARCMANPRDVDGNLIKRVLRYLIGTPICIYDYVWQQKQNVLKVFADSDWAGCKRTRRSTSGGMIVNGKHLIQHWSSTQAFVSLSSAEAELNSANKGAAETILIQRMSNSFNLHMDIILFCDSSAATGACHRQGVGKMKHLSCRQLWLQEQVNSKNVKMEKVGRADNPSDLLTHHWTQSESFQHLTPVSIRRPQVN